jgi:AraC-like DNA-binding protein
MSGVAQSPLRAEELMHDELFVTSDSEPGAQAPAARVSTMLVRALFEAVEACGVSIAEFLRGAGVPTDQFETAYGWVDVSALDRLIQRAVETSGDPAFGLHWVERSPMLKFDVLATATAYAPTLREALTCVLRFQSLLCEQPELALLERDGSTFLHFTPLATTELATRVRTELGIASLVRLMRHVGAPDAAVLGVVFAHPAPDDAREYARLLGTRLRFGQPRSGIEIDAAWLDRRVQHANVELHQLLSQQAQEVLTRVQSRVSFVKLLRDYLERVSPRLPEMPEAARALALSERSLRRRLAEEGWTYAAALLEMRRLLARRLLVESTRSIRQVASDVGFTSSAAFFRAFKRWTGESPGAYRRMRMPRASSGHAEGSRACEAR